MAGGKLVGRVQGRTILSLSEAVLVVSGSVSDGRPSVLNTAYRGRKSRRRRGKERVREVFSFWYILHTMA